MGLSLFSVESLLTCYVFVLKYWTQVLLCYVLPVKTPFLAATKQLYEWFSPSVCLSVTPFWLCSHHCIMMKFIITNDRSDVHAKGQGQRSKVKVTEVKTQFSHFWTVTPVWIHIWWWYDTQSFMMLRRGALLFFKVIVKFQGHTVSILTQIRWFWTVSPVWIHQWLWNDAQSLK